jgi:hypothetical protein
MKLQLFVTILAATAFAQSNSERNVAISGAPTTAPSARKYKIVHYPRARPAPKRMAVQNTKKRDLKKQAAPNKVVTTLKDVPPTPAPKAASQPPKPTPKAAPQPPKPASKAAPQPPKPASKAAPQPPKPAPKAAPQPLKAPAPQPKPTQVVTVVRAPVAQPAPIAKIVTVSRPAGQPVYQHAPVYQYAPVYQQAPIVIPAAPTHVQAQQAPVKAAVQPAPVQPAPVQPAAQVQPPKAAAQPAPAKPSDNRRSRQSAKSDASQILPSSQIFVSLGLVLVATFLM